MLQVRENEISACKLSRGTAQLRIVEGTLTSGFLSRFSTGSVNYVLFRKISGKADLKMKKIGFAVED